MTTFSGGISGIALIACLILQACAPSSLQRRVSSSSVSDTVSSTGVSGAIMTNGKPAVSFGALVITLPSNPNDYFVNSQSAGSKYLVEINPLLAIPSHITASAPTTQPQTPEESLSAQSGKIISLVKGSVEVAGAIRFSAKSSSKLSLPSVTASAPVNQPQTQTPEESLSAQSGKIVSLVKGSVEVVAPESAKEGDYFTVRLVVSPKNLTVVMMQTLKDEFPKYQTIKSPQDIKLKPRMSASVRGSDFEIEKINEEQAVSMTEPTKWLWQVKAIKSGALTLVFRLSGTEIAEGKETPRDYYDYVQPVQVEVSPTNFVKQNWELLMTAFVIPAIGIVWDAFRKPKDAGGKRQPSRVEKLRERARPRRAAPPLASGSGLGRVKL